MATNERLRGSLAAAQLRTADLAERIAVDAKTVERWITKGRQPHRTHRVAVAQVLGVDEGYLWPAVLTSPATQSASVAELLELHPTRAAVPHAVWSELIAGTREALDVLTYAGTFLFEQHDIVEVLRAKSAAGVRCRFLLGDETSPAVRQRAEDEGTSGGLEGRIQLHRRYLRDVAGLPGVEVRTHGTTLYNSLFRFDQDLMVNGHAYGAPAGHSPVLHLRRVPGGRMWDHYLRSFEEVWKIATPET
ncbi:MAG: helix-turn-helix domain-containing protein [Pseudonocardia sp.]